MDTSNSMMGANQLADQIAKLQDSSGCWNVLEPSDRNYPQFNYYVPNYKSTLWTLVLLADSLVDPDDERFKKPLQIISAHFYDKEHGIFSIGKSHFPIPCLNGNMVYLLSYFKSKERDKLESVVRFFEKYQRFDDGDFKTPTRFPYFSNKSCYGSHSCYWGIVKLLKGLVHIPVEERDRSSNELIKKCIDFILLHEVCFSSRTSTDYLHKRIQFLTFPNMYHSDFLEVLWILMKAEVRHIKMERAIELLKSKMNKDGNWSIEKKVGDLIVPFGRWGYDSQAIMARAREVLRFYEDVKI